MTLSVYALERFPQNFQVTDVHGSVWTKVDTSHWRSDDRDDVPDAAELEFRYGPLSVTPPSRTTPTQLGEPVPSREALSDYPEGTAVRSGNQVYLKVEPDTWQNFLGIRTNDAGLYIDTPRLFFVPQESFDA